MGELSEFVGIVSRGASQFADIKAKLTGEGLNDLSAAATLATGCGFCLKVDAKY